MTDSLNSAGYGSEWSFYAAPGGFALVARIERLKDNGDPDNPRFGINDQAQGLAADFMRFFFPRKGRYREIAFIVSNKDWRPQPGGPPASKLTPEEAEVLLQSGAQQLPQQLASLPFTSSHKVTALIYEFLAVNDNQQVAATTPGNRWLTLADHLLHARLAALRP